jgi:hypothetical protein
MLKKFIAFFFEDKNYLQKNEGGNGWQKRLKGQFL